MDWLSEIEESLKNDVVVPSNPAWIFTRMARMARVLRELAEYIVNTDPGFGTRYYEDEGEMSDDAKELCVASRELLDE